jgi:hypothetical protein
LVAAEEILSVRGGRFGAVGKWKVSGESAIFDGTYVGGTAAMNGTKRTVTLKKSGDNNLEGTRFSHFNNQTLPIAYTRAKSDAGSVRRRCGGLLLTSASRTSATTTGIRAF